MEKEHKSKLNIKPKTSLLSTKSKHDKSKKEDHKESKEIKETPHVEDVHTEQVIEEKKIVTPISENDTKIETLSVKKETSITHNEDPKSPLGNFPKPKKDSKKKKEKIVIPFYVFIIILFVFSFGVGGMFAKVLPNISLDFLNGFNPRVEQPASEVIAEVPPVEEVSEPAPIEEPSGIILTTQPPEISAKSYGIFRLKDGEYQQITSKNPTQQLPLASVTKIMTALVAMEQYDLDKPVVVPEKCVGINASSVGFRPNEVFSLQDMLYGLLVKSGADAACAIANIDNESDFIAQMNERALELGMVSTKFTNAIGLDNSDAHVSDVDDLKILVTESLKYSSFRKIVGTEEITLSSKATGSSYRIRNTNDLLFSIPGTVGIKTGYTDSAGECLAYLYANRNEEILIIILGSVDRFGDTSKLLDWAKSEIAANSDDI